MKVYCPYCKKEVSYGINGKTLKSYKGIEIDVEEKIAFCNECKNDLYVNDIEEENNKMIYNVYREKTNIVTPKDIVSLREKYDISQRELTLILGLGKMTINRYEHGGLPNKPQSDYIKLLIEDENKFFMKANEKYKNNIINKKTFTKIKDIKEKVMNSDKRDKNLLREYINAVLYKSPNIYNGYKEFDIDTVENLISYISSKVKNMTITSMNKYLWFIDMLSFNKRGVAITGITYQKQKFGPIIYDKKYEEISKLNDKYTREDYESQEGDIRTKIISNNNYNINQFNENELNIINQVIEILKNNNVKKISNMSHEEDGWKKTEICEKISFDYAKKLKILEIKNK